MLLRFGLINFNSIKVRLEQPPRWLRRFYHANFNSIKVRLERNLVHQMHFLKLFQFHKGTIRTEQGLWTNEKSRNFNSIKVRLEQDAEA